MATWLEFSADAPELADRVRTLFSAGLNKTIATLRRDGSPRISGSELEFGELNITLGMMPGSVKLRDVQRDPRVAIHSPTLQPADGELGDWPGDAKLSGRLVPIDPPTADALPGAYFALDITEVVVISVEGDLLVVESWHPGRGAQRRTRT